MIIFYCLYFSVYYRNEEIVNYLRVLINQLGLASEGGSETQNLKKKSTTKNHDSDKKWQIMMINKLLYQIDTRGIETLSDRQNAHCLEFFHIVFYQAIEDNLRLVYDQILQKLDKIYIRDRDALHFIR